MSLGRRHQRHKWFAVASNDDSFTAVTNAIDQLGNFGSSPSDRNFVLHASMLQLYVMYNIE